jgi:hypothetical protein
MSIDPEAEIEIDLKSRPHLKWTENNYFDDRTVGVSPQPKQNKTKQNHGILSVGFCNILTLFNTSATLGLSIYHTEI